MSGSPDTPGSRRKRVFRACDPCRAKKSKCDGSRPACDRCIGYGYHCVYSVSDKKRLTYGHRAELSQGVTAGAGPADSLRRLVDEYDCLAAELVTGLPEPHRTAAVRRLVELRQGRKSMGAQGAQGTQEASRALLSPRVSSPTPSRPRASTQPPCRPRPERYLGEVSDVRFFHLVDSALQEQTSSGGDGVGTDMAAGGPLPVSPLEPSEVLDSYEQDEPEPQPSPADDTTAAAELDHLPPRDIAERYLDIYFTTIHIAYPFIPRALFVRTYHRYLAAGRASVDSSWLATLYVLFAIGAYYDAISRGTGDTAHEHYFRRALVLADAETPERSVDRVSLLLAQCFYLLAACRTDRCWTTLGLAVRVAQSIGLHVDADTRELPLSSSLSSPAPLLLRTESRRRVWYSIYVLDRLLALQLGRPPAIHDDDCHLQMPSRLGDADMGWEAAGPDGLWTPPPITPTTPTTGDYFVGMIALSRIIGHVLRDLYSPPRARGGVASWLPSTRALDGQLTAWKRALPHALRFDLGHTFETNLAFRRQRNMLAIKYHHLRALIHRPYLCLPLLRRIDGHGRTEQQHTADHPPDLDCYERICIAEAQETAHLLHNVADKESLVHDFPWWQMISCLICASSILVVASVFACPEPDGHTETETKTGPAMSVATSSPVDRTALEDDAETCLKVFEALSVNSEGARIARDMMRRLRARGQRWRESHRYERLALPLQQQQPQPHVPPPPSPATLYAPLPDLHSLAAAEAQPPLSADVSLTEAFSLAQVADEWPSEILDSMTWSAQFFSAADGSVQGFTA